MLARLLFFLLAAASAASALAAPLLLTEPPGEPLGVHAGYLVEGETPLGLEEARSRQREGKFQAGTREVMTFGIDSRPVWIYLDLLNPTDQPLPLQLVVGTTWIDHLDAYIVNGDRVVAGWKTGDSLPRAQAITPGLGYTFAPRFLPGRSELFVRADSADPLVLPLRLLSAAQAGQNERRVHYGYGLMYGYLIALIAYNWMFYTGLRKRGLMYYALYLASFILMNAAYTGHGYAWLWSSHPLIQRYVILASMVLFGCCGLLFATRFLALGEHAPRVLRGVRAFMLVGLALLAASMALDSQSAAAQVAFTFVTAFTLLMVALGVLTVYHRRTEGHYFLAAVIFGMVGSATTALTVWGWIPVNSLTYHSVEMGIVAEATLLALAVARQVRMDQEARVRAEYLAWHDPLTGLHNRRAFLEQARGIWSTAERKSRPLSVVMVDIDHFKQINDRHGHEAGDWVLVEFAQLLPLECRAGDILARWGGEEFVLLLPETGLEQSQAIAERVRRRIETGSVAVKQGSIAITASFGIAERAGKSSLDELIAHADRNLYVAKANGRNRVFSAPTRQES